MFDFSEKWWNKEARDSTQSEGDHLSDNCDCMDCKLKRLESSFFEITQQIREFLEE